MASSGWRVVVADPYAWHLCRLSNTVDKSFKVTAPAIDSNAYLAELAQVVRSEGVSLVLPVSEETLFVAQLRDSVDAGVKIFCIGQDALLGLHDKYLFSEFAMSKALPVPLTVLADEYDASRIDGVDSAGIADASLAQPYIVKPRLSCAGIGVRFGLPGEALHASEISDRNIVQQQMTGLSCSSCTIAIAGKSTVSVCYRSLLESGAVSVLFEEMAVPASIAHFIDTVVKALSYTGMISFDFIQDSDGVWRAIECNPRATSGLHFLQPLDIVNALFNPEVMIEREVSGRRQEFWSCLMQVEGSLFKGRIDRSGWRNLFSVRDISWRWNDVKPFLLMSFVLAPQLFKAMRMGVPVSQVLMSDVGWHER